MTQTATILGTGDIGGFNCNINYILVLSHGVSIISIKITHSLLPTRSERDVGGLVFSDDYCKVLLSIAAIQCNAQEYHYNTVTRNSSNALSSADFSLNYQVTIVDRHIGS
jgi:hypothetical protein